VLIRILVKLESHIKLIFSDKINLNVFNVYLDRDPAFYLNAFPDPLPGSQTNADPGLDPGQIYKSQKV
jgi:hypothetical protein